jgi:hypothetical protein
MTEIPICASCVGMSFFKPVLSSDEKLPKWLENVNYVTDFIKKEKKFKLRHEKKNTFEISFKVGSKYKHFHVLYWAATPSKNTFKIADAKTAYNKFENSGVSKVNKNGELKMFIECPQNYRAISHGSKKEKVFNRHVHFCFQKPKKNKKDKGEWNDKKIYTKLITCDVNLEFKNQSFCEKNQGKCIFGEILLCTLPKKSYQKEHIPNSFHLDAKMVKDMTHASLKKFIINLVKRNSQFSKIQEAMRAKQNPLPWYAIPIILYCKGPDCHASDKCLRELIKKGMVNIKIFRKGMDFYKEKLSHES